MLAINDILISVWGYEQTNVDYYQVTSLVGKSMVEIRQIDQEKTYTASMSGTTRPLKDQFIGPAMRKRVTNDAVKMTSYSYARKVLDSGSHYFSEYA